MLGLALGIEWNHLMVGLEFIADIHYIRIQVWQKQFAGDTVLVGQESLSSCQICFLGSYPVFHLGFIWPPEYNSDDLLKLLSELRPLSILGVIPLFKPTTVVSVVQLLTCFPDSMNYGWRKFEIMWKITITHP